MSWKNTKTQEWVNPNNIFKEQDLVLQNHWYKRSYQWVHVWLGVKMEELTQGFPYWGRWGDGGESPPNSRKFAHSLPSSLAPPNFCHPPTKGSFLPLNNNFLNGPNHSSSDSHHPIKKSPQQNLLSHCTGEKDCPLTP